MLGTGVRYWEYLIQTTDSNNVIKSMALWFPTSKEDARNQLDARDAVRERQRSWEQPFDVAKSGKDVFENDEFQGVEDGFHMGVSDSTSQPRRNHPRAARWRFRSDNCWRMPMGGKLMEGVKSRWMNLAVLLP